ncbi:MAG: DUF4159 domain-containing protein [Planctomycetota bacterium]|nr:DUF4159 domain-containing protein [Planctomycetota bacterium]
MLPKPDARLLRAGCAFVAVAMLLAFSAVARGQAPAGSAAATPAAPAAPPGPAPIRPSDLDYKVISAAVAKGVQGLYRLEPTYTFLSADAFHTFNQGARNASGNHSLACWALLAAGESYQNPSLYRRLNWVLTSDSSYTYDRAIRATMLNQLPSQRWFPWVNRDGVWLSAALTVEGNFSESWAGVPNVSSLGDNANGQYGVLGLWAAQRSGYSIDGKTWQKIDKYWREAQQKTAGEAAAGWGVYSFAKAVAAGTPTFYSRISGPMTAGGVATLCLTERFLYGPSRVDPKQDNVSPQLRKGIRWLDENFSLDDKDEAADRYYYMWTVQRVGEATGYRSFNPVDWFRDVPARILNEQQPDGLWQGDKGALLSTGFALLYLSKANQQPVCVGKIRFKASRDGQVTDDAWHNRPNDIWNFADYASDTYEVNTTWQIVRPTEPVYAMLESPVLYMATNGVPVLSEKEILNLREYVMAGGLIVCNPGHPFYDFYNLHQHVRFNNVLEVAHNGIRPLMVIFQNDIGRSLQVNDVAKGEGFTALSNIYLYATGMNPRRGRLETQFAVKKPGTPSRSILCARIKHNGNFDPEPYALQQLSAHLANKFDVDLQVATVAPSELSQHKIAFLTTLGDGTLSDAEAASIRKWVEAGGTLWIDSAGGNAASHKNSLAFYSKIVPNIIPAPLSGDNPILSGKGLPGGFDNHHVKYRLFALREMGPINSARLQAVELNGRPAVVYSGEDLTCGLAGLDHWNIFGYSPESSRQLVINGVLMALGNAAPNPANSISFATVAAARAAAMAAGAQTQPAPAPEPPAATQP